MTHAENNITNLQTILGDIRSVSNKNNLKYRLEFLYENDSGARIRLAFVKPQNEADYNRILVSGRGFTEDMQTILDEELLIEIKKDQNEWTVTYSETVKPANHNDSQPVMSQVVKSINDVIKSNN